MISYIQKIVLIIKRLHKSHGPVSSFFFRYCLDFKGLCMYMKL